MKGLIFLGILGAGVVILALNPGFIADNMLDFAKQHQKYVNKIGRAHV